MDIARVEAHVPVELRAIPNWLGWKHESRDGKRTKVPVSAHRNCNGRVDDPRTWGTFAQACCAVRRFRLAGLAFIMRKRDGLTAVDLDHCRDAARGHISTDALRIVLALCSYTEVSPSGTGLRIFVRGTLPPTGRRRGNVELYDDLHAMSVTGNHLAFTPRTIERRQAALDALHARIFPPVPVRIVSTYAPAGASDREVLDKAYRARNGWKFRQLFDGTHDQHSASEADLALCRMLAYWTDGDAGQIDSLFRQSKLMRAKWDRRHGSDGRTYGQRTIDKALSAI